MSVVEMCGVLHNLSVIWQDIMPRDMMEHVVEPGRPVVPPVDPILADDVVLDYEQDRVPRARRYAEGKRYRDGMMGRCVQYPAMPA